MQKDEKTIAADRRCKQRDVLLAAAVTLILVVAVGIVFDYYYEFNDDVLMKDILAGVYTGSPAGHNIQMLWPISALLSLIYRILPNAPVYGLFLCACQYGCVFLLTYRAIRISQARRSRCILLVISLLFPLSLMLSHLVMVQYTVTVAIMAATAAFIFYTIPDGLTQKEFLAQSVPAIVLVVLAFLIRSEMLLLMMPYICITGFIRWNRENQNSLRKEIIARYLIVIGIIIAGMGIGYGVDKIAYSSEEWKTFEDEFDARTQLYDYQYVPDYDENEDFYQSIGLGRSDVALLTNYDYGIDPKIDGDILDQVADYADSLRNQPLTSRLKTACRDYAYRIIHFTDMSYQILTLFLYVMLVWAICARTESSWSHKLVILLLRVGGLMVMRSVSWIYIVMGHRAPDRIVHSLYIIEIIILFAMILTEFNSKLREGKYIQMITAVVVICGCGVLIPLSAISLGERIEGQEKINRLSEAIDSYCSQYPDNFYFEDVYSTIRDGETFDQKMFADVDNSLGNYDLIGGWACNSPLYREKLSKFGIENVSDDILQKDNVYIICDTAYSMDWVENYYADLGIEVETEKVATIAATFGVYQISAK